MKSREILKLDWQRLQEVTGQPASEMTWKSCFSPRFSSVYLIRKAHSFYSRKMYRLSKLTSLVNFLVFGAEVPARLEIGPGLVLPHPQGIILGASRIGSNATIFQQVTLGAKTLDFDFNEDARPVLKDNIVVSAGAKIIGGVMIGSDSIVGANAVVNSDVAANSLAVGVPATVRPRTSKEK